MDPKVFGNALKNIRKEEKKMTLVDLEGKTGFSNGYLSMIENGHKGIPPLNTLKKIAIGLGIPLTRIMDIAGYVEESNQLKNMAKIASEVNKNADKRLARINNNNGIIVNPESFPSPIAIKRQINVPIEYEVNGKMKEFNNNDIMDLYYLIHMGLDKNNIIKLRYKKNPIDRDELKKVLSIIETLLK